MGRVADRESAFRHNPSTKIGLLPDRWPRGDRSMIGSGFDDAPPAALVAARGRVLHRRRSFSLEPVHAPAAP
ncbi:hypothetical protein D0T12_08395 [Actinomadura spongiicola]|uniref:Uncharacterized protein n=1 Tax=Actinomadura spongiicola TaxID=2303421 RepID=A0A372GN63_9ACTN|nr:hypothetical protein D0T12_08395 [Actinomadura spongiicola]